MVIMTVGEYDSIHPGEVNTHLLGVAEIHIGIAGIKKDTGITVLQIITYARLTHIIGINSCGIIRQNCQFHAFISPQKPIHAHIFRPLLCHIIAQMFFSCNSCFYACNFPANLVKYRQ